MMHPALKKFAKEWPKDVRTLEDYLADGLKELGYEEVKRKADEQVGVSFWADPAGDMITVKVTMPPLGNKLEIEHKSRPKDDDKKKSKKDKPKHHKKQEKK